MALFTLVTLKDERNKLYFGQFCLNKMKLEKSDMAIQMCFSGDRSMGYSGSKGNIGSSFQGFKSYQENKTVLCCKWYGMGLNYQS